MASLLRPRWLTTYHNWTHPTLRVRHARRRVGIFLFALFFMQLTFWGSRALLELLNDTSVLIPIPLSTLVTPLLFMIGVILLFSTLISNLAVFFVSRDLDLLHAAPLTPLRFFLSRFFLGHLYASWMILIFTAPLVLALGTHYSASVFFYGGAFFALWPLLLIPSALSYCVLSLLLRITPPLLMRKLLFVSASTFLLLLICFVLFLHEHSQTPGALQLLETLQIFAPTFSPLSPPFWSALLLEGLLTEKGSSLVHWTALYGLVASSLALAYLLFRLSYRQSLDCIQAKPVIRGGASLFTNFLHAITFVRGPGRGIRIKEILLQTRELSQVLQVALILMLSLAYIHNLEVSAGVQTISKDDRFWWEVLMVLVNLGMSSLMTAALCTRFVYPSVSFEGRSLWVLLSAPIEVSHLLLEKCRAWLPLTACFHLSICLGALCYLGVRPGLLLIAFFSLGFFTPFLTCLAVICGAAQADFDWEHISQVSSSSGSLLFMIAALLHSALALLFSAVLLGIGVGALQGWIPPFPALSAILLLLLIGYFGYGWLAHLLLRRANRKILHLLEYRGSGGSD